MSNREALEGKRGGRFSRRKLFSTLGFGSLALTVGGLFSGLLAFVFPRLTFEPSLQMALGQLEDFPLHSMKLLDSAQVYVFHDEAGLQAVSSVCTHLGCSYKPFQRAKDSQYGCEVYALCPCHGSAFCRTGKNVGGPAPRPLPFYRLALSPDGRLMVDKAFSDPSDDLSQAAGKGVAHNLYFDPEQGAMVQGPYPSGEETNFTT